MHNKEKDPLDPQTVFTIKHSEIPKGITQCLEHSWIKTGEHELRCAKCPTMAIVDNTNDYVRK